MFPVHFKPPGNSKHKERWHSAKYAIKEKCKTMTASVAHSDVFEAAGGINNSKPMSKEPCNKSQLYNEC